MKSDTKGRVFDRPRPFCSPLLVLAPQVAVLRRITSYVLRIDLVYPLLCTILLHLTLAPSSKMHQVKLRLWPLLGLIALCLCLGPSSIVQSVVSQPLDEPSIEPSPTQASPPVFTDFGRQPVFTPVSPGAECKGSVGSDFTCVDGVWYSSKSITVTYDDPFWHLESPVFVNGSVVFTSMVITLDWRSTPYEDRPCVNRALITASECMTGVYQGTFYLSKKDYKHEPTSVVMFESATGCPTLPSSSYELLDAEYDGGYGKRCRTVHVEENTFTPKCFEPFYPSGSSSTATATATSTATAEVDAPIFDPTPQPRKFRTLVFESNKKYGASRVRCSGSLQTAIALGIIGGLLLIVFVILLICRTSAGKSCCGNGKISASDTHHKHQNAEQYAPIE